MSAFRVTPRPIRAVATVGWDLSLIITIDTISSDQIGFTLISRT